MNFSFEKESGQWIALYMQPIARKYQLLCRPRHTFVRERGGLVQGVYFLPGRSSVHIHVAVIPLYDPFCGSALYDGVPVKIFHPEYVAFSHWKRDLHTEWASDMAYQQDPGWRKILYLIQSGGVQPFRDSVWISQNDPTSLNRTRARERLEHWISFLDTAILPCFEQVNTLEKWREQVEEKRKLPEYQCLSTDLAENYLFGIYDGLQKKYRSSQEKLSKARQLLREMAQTLQPWNSPCQDNVSQQMQIVNQLLDVLCKKQPGWETDFLAVYQQICQKMRILHRLEPPPLSQTAGQ